MRKTSRDGGDTFSATSGVENEIKKPKAGLLLELKSKMIGKRTANLSEESDEAVVEPLLQHNLDNTIISAKYFAKEKADTLKEMNKRFNDKKTQSASTSGFASNETLLSEKDQDVSKANSSNNAPLHNYMNTNVFHSHVSSKANNTTKSQILVEIDGCKQSGYKPNPLIFTTAKIHTDGKSKHMEPVQMTPGPILSTVEASVFKGKGITNDKKVNNGTTVIDTIYSQPPENEKVKDTTPTISDSKIKPETQINDVIIIEKPTNVNEICITKRNSLSDITDSTERNINSIKTSSVVQNKSVSDKANLSKPSIQSTPSNNASEIRSMPQSSKAIPVNVKDNPAITKDTKDDKNICNEPFIVMSESKLKSPVLDKANTINSVTFIRFSAEKPLVETTEISESSSKQPEIKLSNKDEKCVSEKDKSTHFDPNTKRMDIIDAKEIQSKSMKLPVVTKDLDKSKTNTTKSLNLSKSTPAEVSAIASKNELKTISSSPKNSQCSTDSSAKTFSSSTKTTAKSNVIDSKINKDIDKSPKPSANEITKPNSKMSLNNPASSSTNKLPTSSPIVKPAHNISLTNVPSSSTTATSNKTLSSPSVSNSKTISSTTTSAATTVSPSAIKTQSTNTKIASSTTNTKTTPVTSAKSSTKPSSASSLKSPNTSITTTKQINASTAKTASGKPPPLALTKTTQVNVSSPNATAPASKPTVSKIAQVSSSNSAGNKGRSAAASSTMTSETSNKTKAPEANKKGESKHSDQTKQTKVSKG